MRTTPRLQTFMQSRRLRLPEAAEYLGVTRRTLASTGWRIKHRIPTIAIGRALVFDTAALDGWLAQHAVRMPAEQGGCP